MFISIYFKTSFYDCDPEINTLIYGPPASIHSASVSSPAYVVSEWTDVSGAPGLSYSVLAAFSLATQWEVTGHLNL